MTGAGLIAVLGWAVEDFESACDEASAAEMEDALRILEEPDNGESDARQKSLCEYGIRYLKGKLGLGPPPEIRRL